MNIKLLRIGDQEKQVYTYYSKKTQDIVKFDALKIWAKIRSLHCSNNDRKKLITSYGVWFVTKDDNYYYGVCTSDQYPQRHAYALINQVQRQIRSNNNKQKITSQTQQQIQQLCKKYDNLCELDKLQKAIGQAKELENQLGSGVRRLINNQNDLQELNSKAQQLKSYGLSFEENANKIQKQMCWHKWRIWIITGIIISTVIVIIVIVIIATTKR